MSDKGVLAKIARQPVVVRLWSDHTLHLFAADAPGAGAPDTLDIRINDMAHVERFEQTEPWQSRDDFIAAARQRIETGTSLLFSVAHADGPLLGFGIAQPNARETLYTHVGQRVLWPERTATMFGGYIHPMARGRGLHTALQTARIHYLVGTLGMRWVVSAVVSDNAAALASAGKTNAHPVAILNTRRRLGRARMTARRLDPAFDAKFVDAQQEDAAA
ncbi:GNAT family N-acetyltransferase [Sphingosinicella soli]|uniref:RimJ/RimL family protein N-acetyltransferase n=1 Tax=Sphingosinicella soli TaxID=333708 RepID=A0A7W7F9F9_9SPHN|nr:GNAT family N-acetyltransferase [Sphingosinicella soli]MBB4632618.1 RimJ/RimL family protein N-acetyltransferase [Sphingosinicella soli]